MLSFIKVIFIVIAGIFLVSILNESGPLFDSGSSASYEPADRSAYTRSYDTNNDGVVSDAEYKAGELSRIQTEVETLEREVAKAKDEGVRSPYWGLVRLSADGAYAEERNDEYLRIETEYGNTAPINITGWRAKSLVSGRSATIGKGIRYLETNRPWYFADDIYLAPGDIAYAVTGGAAGINTSFLSNSCLGYLDVNDRFTPSVFQSCPALSDEDIDAFGLSYDDIDDEEDYDMCRDAIEDLSSCERGFADRDLPDECRSFIRKYATYDGCVDLHRDDPDFLGNEWRIYFNSSRDELWRQEREAIELLDKNGLVVDVVRY